MSCWAIVPAAGSGQRFSDKLPKQYALLANKTVLQHSLEALLNSDIFTEVTVTLAKDDQRFHALAIAKNPKIRTCIGGASRASSVLNGLLSLTGKASADDWVMVHDGARPLLNSAAVIGLYESLKQDTVGGLLALPVNDTLKKAESKNTSATEQPAVTHSVDRSGIWAAQTPQMFRYQLLLESLEAALANVDVNANAKDDGITDEAFALEKAGYRVKLVRGERSNIKITTTDDIALANCYLALRQEKQKSSHEAQS